MSDIYIRSWFRHVNDSLIRMSFFFFLWHWDFVWGKRICWCTYHLSMSHIYKVPTQTYGWLTGTNECVLCDMCVTLGPWYTMWYESGTQCITSMCHTWDICVTLDLVWSKKICCVTLGPWFAMWYEFGTQCITWMCHTWDICVTLGPCLEQENLLMWF